MKRPSSVRAFDGLKASAGTGGTERAAPMMDAAAAKASHAASCNVPVILLMRNSSLRAEMKIQVRARKSHTGVRWPALGGCQAKGTNHLGIAVLLHRQFLTFSYCGP